MFDRLRQFLRGARPDHAPVPFPEGAPTILEPDQPFCAIGDVHGCFDLLEPLYTRIRSEFGPDLPVIFLGDLVDRGLSSADTLDFVRNLTETAPASHVALKGNHELMMLDFLHAPADRGHRWLRFGGAETLQSYGIAVLTDDPDQADLERYAFMLHDSAPPGLIHWMDCLPAHWQTGNMHCVHAAMAPDVSVLAQNPKVMIQGHRDFLRKVRRDGQTVVHGHTVVETPYAEGSRVAVDTGAFFTGRLTAAYIAPGECRFIT